MNPPVPEKQIFVFQIKPQYYQNFINFLMHVQQSNSSGKPQYFHQKSFILEATCYCLVNAEVLLLQAKKLYFLSGMHFLYLYHRRSDTYFAECEVSLDDFNASLKGSGIIHGGHIE